MIKPLTSELTHSPRKRGDKGGKTLKRTKTRITRLEKDKILNRDTRICVRPELYLMIKPLTLSDEGFMIRTKHA